MPKDEWGVKRACPECAVRFYDLQKDPMVCPGCGAIFDLASLTQTRQKTVEKPKPKAKVEPAVPEVDDTADILTSDDDNSEPSGANVGDDLLDDDDEDTVSLEVIADVSKEDDD